MMRREALNLRKKAEKLIRLSEREFERNKEMLGIVTNENANSKGCVLES